MDGQLYPALVIIPFIYVFPYNSPLQAAGHAPSWRQGNLETPVAKCVLKVMGPIATNEFQDEQLCSVLKAVFYGAVHGDQSIWDNNLSIEKYGCLLMDTKTLSTRPSALEFFGQFAIYGCL